MTRVGVIDYGMGNLHSVAKAVALQGGDVFVSDSKEKLKGSDLLVLPGVGAFGAAMTTLGEKGLEGFVRNWVEDDKPYLGICLGFQLLFEESEESPNVKGLGVLPGRVVRFKKKEVGNRPIPHMGWNTLSVKKKSSKNPLQGFKPEDYFYFVHSYFPVPKEKDVIFTETNYGKNFCSSVLRKNLFATQFHPEKSGSTGLKLLNNILRSAS